MPSRIIWTALATKPDAARARRIDGGRGNYAIVNRLLLFEQVALAFRRAFGAELELVNEISQNLAQHEWHPDFSDVWVHRKGATRAFPATHPALEGT